jgi:hypothetical protein
MPRSNEEPHPPTAEDEPPITVLVVCEVGATAGAMSGHLAAIAARYAPMVALRTVTPDQLPARYAHLAGAMPTVLVLRRGHLVGGAAGSSLPARELDAVVRCAVEWTDRDAA